MDAFSFNNKKNSHNFDSGANAQVLGVDTFNPMFLGEPVQTEKNLHRRNWLEVPATAHDTSHLKI